MSHCYAPTCCAQTFASQERRSSHQELQACAARMLDHCQRFLDGRLPSSRESEWVNQMRLKTTAMLAVSSSVAEPQSEGADSAVLAATAFDCVSQQPATMMQEPEQNGADPAAARRQQVRAAQAAALERLRAQQAAFLISALRKPALPADASCAAGIAASVRPLRPTSIPAAFTALRVCIEGTSTP